MPTRLSSDEVAAIRDGMQYDEEMAKVDGDVFCDTCGVFHKPSDFLDDED
jgi:hypothetical protein